MCLGKSNQTKKKVKKKKKIKQRSVGSLSQSFPEHQLTCVSQRQLQWTAVLFSFPKQSLKMHSVKKYVGRELCGSYRFHYYICLQFQGYIEMILCTMINSESQKHLDFRWDIDFRDHHTSCRYSYSSWLLNQS